MSFTKTVIAKSIEAAVVMVLVTYIQDGVQQGALLSGFMIGPDSVATALHGLDHPGITSVTVIMSDKQYIPADMNSTQTYVDLTAWHNTIVANGGETIKEVSTDIAVLKTTQAIGFQTGWFPLYDLHNGPVTIHGYPAGVYTVFTGGILQDVSTSIGNYSAISGVTGAPGDSGGLIMDAAGNAVGSVFGGSSAGGMIAVDFSSKVMVDLNDSIAINNTSIQPEITGRTYYDIAHHLSSTWAELNLSSLVATMGGPNTVSAAAQIKSTVENAIVAAVHEVGPDVAVDVIAGAFGVSLSPNDHQSFSAEMAAHPIELIGLLAQADLSLMGAIPM